MVTNLMVTNLMVTNFAQCLIGIIFMQIGQEYARRTEEREQRELDEKSRQQAAQVVGEKKDQ